MRGKVATGSFYFCFRQEGAVWESDSLDWETRPSVDSLAFSWNRVGLIDKELVELFFKIDLGKLDDESRCFLFNRSIVYGVS